MQKKRLVLWFVIVAISLCAFLCFYSPLRSRIPFYEKFREVAIIVLRNPFCSFIDTYNGMSKAACIYRLCALFAFYGENQLMSTDSEGCHLIKTSKGNFWVPPKMNLGYFTLELAEQECKIYRTDKVGVRSGDIVLDCGANIGLYTREALNCGAKLVVAIEPAPMNINCLKKNFKKEVDQGRVIIYEKGVWDSEKILSFKISENSVDATFVLPLKNSNTISVPVTTIDKIVNELKLDRVDFIKMDIEGAEKNALIGAKETILKYKPRMAVCVYHILEEIGQIKTMVERLYPNCQTSCGTCGIAQGRLTPQVMFFY